jgi:hypothetical protein
MNKLSVFMFSTILLMSCAVSMSDNDGGRCKLTVNNVGSSVFLHKKQFNRIQYLKGDLIVSDAYWCLNQDSLWMVPVFGDRIIKDSSLVLFAILNNLEIFNLNQRSSGRIHLGYYFMGNTSQTADPFVFKVQHLILNNDGLAERNNFPFNQKFEFLINNDGILLCSDDIMQWNKIFNQFW